MQTCKSPEVNTRVYLRGLLCKINSLQYIAAKTAERHPMRVVACLPPLPLVFVPTRNHFCTFLI